MVRERRRKRKIFTRKFVPSFCYVVKLSLIYFSFGGGMAPLDMKLLYFHITYGCEALVGKDGSCEQTQLLSFGIFFFPFFPLKIVISWRAEDPRDTGQALQDTKVGQTNREGVVPNPGRWEFILHSEYALHRRQREKGNVEGGVGKTPNI